jgi:hypothetical protein
MGRNRGEHQARMAALVRALKKAKESSGDIIMPSEPPSNPSVPTPVPAPTIIPDKQETAGFSAPELPVEWDGGAELARHSRGEGV